MSLLGLDVGTAGCKAMLINTEGKILAYAAREYPFIHPKPGWVELDPGLVWRSVREVVAETAGRAGNDPVAALSISSHGESITPVDAGGVPLGRTIVSLDKRAASMLEFWDGFGPERLQRITGLPLHHKHSVNRLIWLRRNRPEVFGRAWKFLCYEEYILTRLGLPPVISAPLAARTMAFDVERGVWSEEVLSYAGIDSRLLPSVQDSGRPIGVISRAAADELGLSREVLAVSGGHDQPCSALGAGVLAPGPAVDSLGTVEAFTAVTPDRMDAEVLLASGYPRYPHVAAGRFVTMAVNPNGGSLFRWYRDNIAGEERRAAEESHDDAYRLIIEGCRYEPSPVLVLPYFAGRGTPAPDPARQGAILGLGLGTTRHDIAWAILESQAFELRLNIMALAEAGVKITSLRAVGGGAKSVELLRLRAAVLGFPVARLQIREAACLGAAMLAGVGAGIFRSLDEAAQVLIQTETEVEPDPAQTAGYEEKFRVYAGLREAEDPFAKTTGGR